MLRFLLFAFFVILSASSRAQMVRCEQIHGDLVVERFRFKFHQALLEQNGSEISLLMVRIGALRPELIYGKENAKWEDFENLKTITTQMKMEIQKIHASKGEAGVQKFYQELNQVEGLFNQRRRTGHDNELPSKIQYGPIDYGLRVAYRKEIEKLNQILPSNMRFVFRPFPENRLNQELIKESAEIVAANEDLVRELLPTSGYKDIAELVEGIRTKGNEDVKFALELLTEEKFEFAMTRPENARWWIPKVGFHNQHVTGSSGGYNGTIGRNALEASRLNVSFEEYQDQNADLKPKYGWLIPALGSGLVRRDVHYGSDIFIFKKKSLGQRTTWTAGDSLNSANRWIPGWGDGQTSKPTHWEEAFVPWSQRALLAPLIQGFQKANQMIQNVPTVGKGLPDFQRKFSNREYVELQIWGPLSLSDVSAFVFQRNPPSGEFLEALQAQGIRIYRAEGDSKTYTPWSPPKESTP